jgi:poly(A) polymerase
MMSKESGQEAMEECLRVGLGVARGEFPFANSPAVQLVGVSANSLPGHQIRELLEQILIGEHVSDSLQWLHDCGLLGLVLPELEATVNFTQEMDRRHKDVWKHTKQVVAQSVLRPELRWAALLHDIGKVPTRVFTKSGKVTFHGHAEVGARMFDRIARRLSFPKAQRAKIRFLILYHLRANQYDESWTDSAVRRFDREMGEHLDDLLDLSRADITSARAYKRLLALRQLEELLERIIALREIDSRLPPLPSGIGNVIMQHFELKPGRIIGTLKKELEGAINTGRLEPQREPEYYLEYLAKHSESLEKASE